MDGESIKLLNELNAELRSLRAEVASLRNCVVGKDDIVALRLSIESTERATSVACADLAAVKEAMATRVDVEALMSFLRGVALEVIDVSTLEKLGIVPRAS